MVTAAARGTARMVATLDGRSDTTVVTVTAPPLLALASPAAGYKQLHDEQQKALVEQALTLSAGTEPRAVAPRPLLAGEDY